MNKEQGILNEEVSGSPPSGVQIPCSEFLVPCSIFLTQDDFKKRIYWAASISN